MNAILFEPHSDDAVLFATFLCCRHKPRVITCLQSHLQDAQGITAAEREAETAEAMRVLGCEWEQWDFPDTGPDWAAVEQAMVAERDLHPPGLVFAPADERNGNEQHNEIARLADKVFGYDCVTHYLTYQVYPGGKSRLGELVEFEPGWVRLKLLALACYRSQIERGPVRHFMDSLEEYVAS